MLNKIKEEVKDAYTTLQQKGHDVYLVGGCVRNLIMNIEPNDWDLATNATPDQIQEIFPDSYYDNTYGTVGVPIKKDDQALFVIEITTFRRESGYENLRHPTNIEWGETIEEDLSRRDFTMNAIALKLSNLDQSSPASTSEAGQAIVNHQSSIELIDPYNGQSDIKDKLIKTVGNADDRFNEDALRIMRAIRFASQLDFEIDNKTWESIVKHKDNILKISKERIRDELLKILSTDRAYEGVILLDKAGILDLIIPELTKGKGLSQARPDRHHVHDVFTHNLLALQHTPSTDPITRLATLLHDIGKPYVEGKDESDLIIFYNHEVVGARIAAQIADSLHLSRKQREKIFTLVRWHMFSVDEHITDSAVRRFIRRVGLENVSDMIDLRIGDRLGSGTQTAESWRLKLFKERIEKELNPAFSINDLAIDGNDIMRELNLKPGPKVGKILQTLFEEVDEDMSKNNKEYLLNRIKELSVSS